jgi:hypothetical protein
MVKVKGCYLGGDIATTLLGGDPYHACEGVMGKEDGYYYQAWAWGYILEGKCSKCGYLLSNKERFLLNLVGW